MKAPYDTNEAVLPNKTIEGRVTNNDKRERIGTLRVIVYDPTAPGYAPSGFHEPLLARFYMGRSSRSSVVYCNVWIRTRDGIRYFHGSGSASGYGYHKESAAFQAALDSAGVSLSANCDGCGTSAMRVAAEAVARACGYIDTPMHTIDD